MARGPWVGHPWSRRSAQADGIVVLWNKLFLISFCCLYFDYLLWCFSVFFWWVWVVAYWDFGVWFLRFLDLLSCSLMFVCCIWSLDLFSCFLVWVLWFVFFVCFVWFLGFWAFLISKFSQWQAHDACFFFLIFITIFHNNIPGCYNNP